MSDDRGSVSANEPTPIGVEVAGSAAELLRQAHELRARADVLEHAAKLLLHLDGQGDHPGYRYAHSAMFEY